MNARDVARRVLARVEDGGYANLSLAGEMARMNIVEADRGLATELVYGVLRQRTRLDRAIAACTTRGPKGLEGLDETALEALRIAAYQILFLRVPAHAAVDDAVRAIKRVRGDKLAGFANAVLRKLARDGEPPLPPITPDAPADSWADSLAFAHSTPRWIVDEVVRVVGAESAEKLLAAWNQAAPTWVRANTLRADRERVRDALCIERPRAELMASPLIAEALAITRGGDVFSTKAHAEGLFIAQDLGAQAIAHLLAPRQGEGLLDACAGVGGKSTHLAALTDDKSHIDAADLSPRKLELAADHARRLGVKSVRGIAIDLLALPSRGGPLADLYDRVLLDAPCSGLGVLRRHPELKWRRTEADVRSLAELQRQLLDRVAPRVRPGGVLVYAVCTYTELEGPAQVRSFLERHQDFEPDAVPVELGALCDGPAEGGVIRTWPQRDDADAFYAARFHKKT